MPMHGRPLPYRWVGWWPVRLLRRALVVSFYYPVLRIWMRRLVVEGRERIPTGPVIYAATHTSMADTPLILWAVGVRGNRLVVTAARDFFFRHNRPGFGPFVALVFGAIPIDRTGSPRQSLSDAITWLRSGFAIVIYPQGTIPDHAEDETRLHRGVALLAKQSMYPVVPVRIIGASDLLPAGIHWPRRAVVRITFLPPMLFAHKENTERFTDRLRASLFDVTTE
ncbi:MAG: 1-acyl-sn-glycerol-3-phosphate acyltransferase [Chloroflexota bacterium]|nr:1-acyl-sn-glycerol-3-phosphate acyltransferase [Chloroflexota bacterium]